MCKRCVCKSGVAKLCELCVSKLCVCERLCVCATMLCVKELCAKERERRTDTRGGRTEDGSVQQKTRTPHNDVGKAATREFYPIQSHQNVLDVSNCRGS